MKFTCISPNIELVVSQCKIRNKSPQAFMPQEVEEKKEKKKKRANEERSNQENKAEPDTTSEKYRKLALTLCKRSTA